MHESHLFIVQSDISKVSCDAWLMPSGATTQSFFNHHPHHRWLQDYATNKLRQTQRPGSKFCDLDPDSYPKLIKKDSLIHLLEHTIPNYPQIYSLFVGHFALHQSSKKASDKDPKTEAIKKFFKVITKDLTASTRNPLNNRERFLVALPVIGTGGAGFLFQTGQILKNYIQCILKFVNNQDLFDVLLCVYDRPTLITAQRIRAEIGQNISFSALLKSPPFGLPQGTNAFDFADKLAKQLSENKLVLFLGSDTNRELGIPTIDVIIDKLAVDLGININTPTWERTETLSKADIVQLRCKKKNISLGELISEELHFGRNPLQILLLAGLQASGVVTTNFDVSYENSVNSLKERYAISIIPNKVIKNADRWLLKLKGCVSSPDTIIASRQDFMRYMESNAALAGIVQAKLLTSHLLFVGFSLDDGTFHQIMDSVLKAQRNSATTCVGTCLQTLHNPFTSEIWNPLIQCVSMRESPPDGNSTERLKQEAFRHTEIFLDLLLLKHTMSYSGHILDHRFKHILSKEEAQLKILLQSLANSLEIKCGPSYKKRWPVIEQTLNNYGFEGNMLPWVFENAAPVFRKRKPRAKDKAAPQNSPTTLNSPKQNIITRISNTSQLKYNTYRKSVLFSCFVVLIVLIAYVGFIWQ